MHLARAILVVLLTGLVPARFDAQPEDAVRADLKKAKAAYDAKLA